MLKKNSWIVALILALSFTALFTGCIDAIEEEGGNVTYTEVALGKFNVWGGQAYQQGWGVEGINFSGIGDKAEKAADLGYKLADFQKAKFLVIEMEDDTHPKGNVDIIWGGEGEDGTDTGIGGWNQTGGIAFKKDGNTITIELAKVLKDYSKFKAATTKKVKIVLQAGGEPDKLAGLVKSAKLLIPDVEPPYVEVKNITLAQNSFYWSNELTLAGTTTPDDATNQGIIWSIKSWTPGTDTIGGGTTVAITSNDSTSSAYDTQKAALLGKVAFFPKTITVVPAKTYVDNSVQPPKTIPSLVTEITLAWQEDDVIYIPAGNGTSNGRVVVTARIEDGKINAKRDGTETYEQDFIITIGDAPALNIKFDAASVATYGWGGKANSGNSSIMTLDADDDSATGYTMTVGSGYNNTYHWIRIDFPMGKTLSSYQGLSFKYKDVDDYNYKDIRVYGSSTVSKPSGYGPGINLSRIASGDATVEKTLTVKFGCNHTVGAGDTSFATGMAPLNSATSIYLWFVPWGAGGEFHIGDITFLTTVP